MIIHNGLLFSSGSDNKRNTRTVELTPSHYENLSAAEKCSGDIFFITDNESAVNFSGSTEHPIKLTSCTRCGAPLDIDHYLLQESGGMCKCEYCDTFNYVW